MILKDYQALASVHGPLNVEANERTHWLKLASQHLNRFKKWYEQGPFFQVAPLGAASLYCQSHGLPSRAQLTNTLAQVYEQKVQELYHPYVPHLNPSRPVSLFLSNFIGGKRRKKIPLQESGA